jgi:predicted Fe-Mo cluster-binding NifX family protein
MKVCITAGASGLDAPLDPGFGRCPFFVMVDLDSMNETSVSNTNAWGIPWGASALITGNIGSNALQTLTAANIEVYQQQGGTVRDAVDKFKRGELMKISSPTRPAHAGMGQGRGKGGGFGAGQGRGAGMGGSQGSGRGSGVGACQGGQGQ